MSRHGKKPSAAPLLIAIGVIGLLYLAYIAQWLIRHPPA